MVYLIEKLWLDPMENEASAAYGYDIIGYILDKMEADLFCINGRVFTANDCWALVSCGPLPEYRYKEIEKL